MKPFLFFFIGILLISSISAFNSSSTDYQSYIDIGSGGNMSSADFQMIVSIGESSIGNMSSADYQMSIGFPFEAGLNVSAVTPTPVTPGGGGITPITPVIEELKIIAKELSPMRLFYYLLFIIVGVLIVIKMFGVKVEKRTEKTAVSKFFSKFGKILLWILLFAMGIGILLYPHLRLFYYLLFVVVGIIIIVKILGKKAK